MGNVNAIVEVIDSPYWIDKIKPVMERVNAYYGEDIPFGDSTHRYFIVNGKSLILI